MKTKYYKSLCRYCDKILLSKDSTIFTYSITDLHVLKEHPVLLNNYFKNNTYSNNERSNLILKIFKYLTHLFFKEKNFKLTFSQKKRHDILILSNLINKSHLNNINDFYFGNLQSKLNSIGLKTITILRNFTNEENSKLNQKLTKNKILLFKTTYITMEIKFLLRALLEYFLIKKNFQKPKTLKLNSSFLSLLSFKSMISNLRLSFQIKKLVQVTNPKIVIITFEGHAWERVLIKTLKELNSQIKIVGYQFSSITKYQHSVFRKLKNNYNPDLILSSGEITKKKFLKTFKSDVEIIGSFKSNQIKYKKYKSSKNVFLFLPEAFYSETIFLYNFAYDCAVKYPNLKFVFKCHPMMIDFIQKKSTLKNLNISKKNLNDELKKSKFVIFRGSASVFEAVLAGSIPIYLSKPNEMSINPLFEAFPKKQSITYADDLLKIIKYDIKKNRQLLNYCKRFFTPLTHQPIKDYFKKIC